MERGEAISQVWCIHNIELVTTGGIWGTIPLGPSRMHLRINFQHLATSSCLLWLKNSPWGVNFLALPDSTCSRAQQFPCQHPLQKIQRCPRVGNTASTSSWAEEVTRNTSDGSISTSSSARIPMPDPRPPEPDPLGVGPAVCGLPSPAGDSEANTVWEPLVYSLVKRIQDVSNTVHMFIQNYNDWKVHQLQPPK